MTSLPRLVAWLLVLAPIVLCACGTTPPAAELEATPTTSEQAIADRLELYDPRTGEHLGQRFLELELKNKSGERVTCRCASEWIDAKGQVISVSAWRDVDLAPGARERVRFAPMPAAAGSHRLRFQG